MRKTKPIRKINILFLLIMIAFIALLGAITVYAQANEAQNTQDAVVIWIEENKVLEIYPDYYIYDGKTVVYSGEIILTGKSNTDIRFKRYAEGEYNGEDDTTVTYNVTMHGLTTQAQSWHGMISIDNNVIVNMTAVGKNSVFGSNGYAIYNGESNGSNPPVVNLTVAENSSIELGSQEETSVNSPITMNVVSGTPSVSMEDEDWRNRNLTVSNGEALLHQMTQSQVTNDNRYCSEVTCDKCGIIGKSLHTPVVKQGGESTQDGHDSVCSVCDSDSGIQPHAYGRKSALYDDVYHVPRCEDCGFIDLERKEAHTEDDAPDCDSSAYCYGCGMYYGLPLGHTPDENLNCTVCEKSLCFEVIIDEGTYYCATLWEIDWFIDGKDAYIKVLTDVNENSDITKNSMQISGNNTKVVFDLAGFALAEQWIELSESIEFTLIDSSEWKTGRLVNIDGNTFSLHDNAKLIIKGGTIEGGRVVDLGDNSTLEIYDAKINCTNAVELNNGFVGKISLYGGTFLGGISIYDWEESTDVDATEIEKLLATDCYIYVDENGNELTADDNITDFAGSVIVKHREDTFDESTVFTNNGDTHTYTCPVCSQAVTGSHTGGTQTDNGYRCPICDEKLVAKITEKDGTVTYYTDFEEARRNWSIDNSSNNTLTLLEDAVYEYIELAEGRNILDLNGFTLDLGDGYIAQCSTQLTIQGGPGSKIVTKHEYCLKGSPIYISGNVQIQGGKASFFIGVDNGLFIFTSAPEHTYTVLMEEAGVFAKSADGVTLDASKFVSANVGYITTVDEDGYLSLEECVHDMAEATCVTPSTCKNGCGYTEGEINPDAHAWNEGVVTTNPTCSAVGKKTFTCTHNSAHTKTEDINALGHKYDNACDSECNTCGEERTPAEHVDADENNACDECGAELPRDGLGAGAIAGIVAGSIAVLGGGGFALWWFVFRKKRII